MTMTARLRRSVALLLLALPAVASAQSRRIELADLARIVRVSEAQLSPDGRMALILVARPDYDENRYRTDLVRVDVATREQRVLLTD